MNKKKDAYYFPHFSNARNDAKLIRVRRILGVEGYGAFFMLLEVLREQSDFKFPIAGVEDLAYDLRISKEKLFSIINDYDLFTVENGYFYSENLISYLQPYLEKSHRARLAAQERWKKALDVEYAEEIQEQSEGNTKEIQKQSKSNANALHEQSKCNAKEMQEQSTGNASKVKYSKVNKSKLNESKKKESKLLFTNEKQHFFKDSIYFDYNVFKDAINEDLKKYDLLSYHKIAVNYSKSKQVMYFDWLATIENWILKDIKEGKVKFAGSTSEISDYEAMEKAFNQSNKKNK